ncbi:hypothetical protein [Sandarakinorhabdus rubra]|uniref:hypothetical protein n=1 Tax=Sandarakinorhabdus rubra TaxID=2672568 RepID=UPI0013DB92A1|nr:hypothetical protein [Sandarakinorhabdus rubra]
MDLLNRELLLTLHLLGIIVWIGFGLCEYWLGRVFLTQAGSPAEAPLIRFIYRCDLVVFIATLISFAAGTAMALLLGWGFFNELWLGIKQGIMFTVLAVVGIILPRALRLGTLIDALPAGPGPVTAEIRALYHWLDPFFLVMRALAVAAVVLAVWRPA